MTTIIKDEWPRTDQGVIDWEHVFEDEQDGLIPVILLANTPFVLKECSTLIIQQLFSRENDSMNIMKHIIALERIIPDQKEMSLDKNALAAMRAQIATRLRKIKDDRIQKSEEFIKHKKLASKERRSSS